MRSPGWAAFLTFGLQHASVHQPWKGFGANPPSVATTYENTRGMVPQCVSKSLYRAPVATAT